jgi:hypothetical protein
LDKFLQKLIEKELVHISNAAPLPGEELWVTFSEVLL